MKKYDPYTGLWERQENFSSPTEERVDCIAEKLRTETITKSDFNVLKQIQKSNSMIGIDTLVQDAYEYLKD